MKVNTSIGNLTPVITTISSFWIRSLGQVLKISARISAFLSLLMGVFTIFWIRTPPGWNKFLSMAVGMPKILGEALAPYIAVMRILAVLISLGLAWWKIQGLPGFMRKPGLQHMGQTLRLAGPFTLLAGIAGAALCGIYLLRVTAPQSDFLQAFGENWCDRISAEQGAL